MRYWIPGSGRERHLANSSSSCLLRLETWPEETSKPQSSSMTLVTRRVLTPWT